jgi:hypothetical protein
MHAIAFSASRCIAQGELAYVTQEAKAYMATHPTAQILAFDAESSEPIELDLRTNISVFLEEEPTRRPGRPKLGVVPREVTLLARHWDWLNDQPSGASAAIRRLVEQASKDPIHARKAAQAAAYKFLAAMLGNAPNFEEATRALFANNKAAFQSLSDPWPQDLRDHARTLAAKAFIPPNANAPEHEEP